MIHVNMRILDEKTQLFLDYRLYNSVFVYIHVFNVWYKLADTTRVHLKFKLYFPIEFNSEIITKTFSFLSCFWNIECRSIFRAISVRSLSSKILKNSVRSKSFNIWRKTFLVWKSLKTDHVDLYPSLLFDFFYMLF